MQLSTGLSASVFALAAAVSFGIADFCGGVAAKRTRVFGVLTAARLCGLVIMIAAALATGERAPSGHALAWACAAGLIGGVALPAFYRALAVGKMGVGAPVTAVLTVAVPVVVAAFTEGFPRPVQAAGLLLAVTALWLISRPDAKVRSDGLGLALLAGLGFGSFLVCIHQASADSVYWPMAAALASSFLVSALVLAAQGGSLPGRSAMNVVIVAGTLDSCGNVLFVLASKYGRLDVAAILCSLYPAVTVILAWLFLKEQITRLQTAGMTAALIAVPLIAAH